MAVVHLVVGEKTRHQKTNIAKGKVMKNSFDYCLLGLIVCIGLGLMGFNAVLVLAQCRNEMVVTGPCTTDTCLVACPIKAPIVNGEFKCPEIDGAAVAEGKFASEVDSNSYKQAFKNEKLAACTIIITKEDCQLWTRTTELPSGAYEVQGFCEVMVEGTTMYEEVEYEEEPCGIYA